MGQFPADPPALAASVPTHANPLLMARLDVPPPPASRIKAPERVSPPRPEASPAARVAAPSDIAYPARRTSTGDRSMIRALGLKINRIVIDPGHGGHDTGTIGPGGLREKDLVLDVSLRLGALIEARMGSKVVFTRSDDRFIPLEERTALANANQADLFLSIHANSSPEPSASGVETYYLNFTTSRDALDLAARENADSTMTINELQGVLQKIALKDKVDESREFAQRIQAALSASSKAARNRDRGIRRAPFVVLIGATMPSVLAEIGFVSNVQDEKLMKRPETRQKIAESLYKGLSQYASTLSHFQVAETKGLAAH
jgi:N-acetylmuramoyl-L-alanine amidase